MCNLGLHIANHVLEMSVELKVQCVCFEKKHCFALVVLNWFRIFFFKACSNDETCIIRNLLHYNAETKKMVYKSVNLKGVVYEPTQNSFDFFGLRFCERWRDLLLKPSSEQVFK